MASGLGFILDAASIILPFTLANPPPKPEKNAETNIKFFLGGGSNTAGGPCPHVALWDNDGNRIGQYHPGKDCGNKGNIGEANVADVTVRHSQTVPPNSQADPYYVMISQLSDDAICLASVSVKGASIEGSFFGDLGYKCGQSWFHSDKALGSDFTKPKCVWLDGNHDSGINSRAISFHLNDLAGNKEKMAQYNENQDTLCKSSPRFSFWGNLLPDGTPPFFKPKLEYQGDNGRDVDINKVLDDPNHPVDKSVYLNQGESKARKPQRLRKLGRRSQGSNHDLSHLIITDRPDAGARQVCEDPKSYGWDLANTHEGLFCDMESKILYPICTESITQNCFDLGAKTLKPGIQPRDEHFVNLRFGRNYTSKANWKRR